MSNIQHHSLLKKFSELPLGGFQFFSGEKTIPLHTMMIHCGHQIVDSAEYRWNGLKRGQREFAIWQFSVKGKGALHYEDKKYEIPPGSAMLLHIPHNHCYFFPENFKEPWEFIYIAFNGREFMRIWYILEKSVGPVTSLIPLTSNPDREINIRVIKFLNTALSIIQNAICRQLPDNAYGASANAYNFLMELCEILANNNSRFQSHNIENIKKVIDFCIRNISEPITVDDMAAVAGYSRYYFTRIFRDSHAMSPGKFLLDLRMKYAIRLLQTEKLTVKEISYKCGFSDPSYFCKMFKRFYNISPAEFRKSNF